MIANYVIISFILIFNMIVFTKRVRYLLKEHSAIKVHTKKILDVNGLWWPLNVRRAVSSSIALSNEKKLKIKSYLQTIPAYLSSNWNSHIGSPNAHLVRSRTYLNLIYIDVFIVRRAGRTGGEGLCLAAAHTALFWEAASIPRCQRPSYQDPLHRYINW